MKRTKKVTNVAILVMALVITATLVGAALLTSFGTVETTITAKQSVQIDNHNWDEPLAHTFESYGGCCECFEHTVTNYGCQGIWLDWEHTPIDEGIYFTVYEKEPGCCTHELELLEVNVLDGQANWDDFDVFVDGILVYSYAAVGGGENWILHSIDLTPFDIICCGPHTIEIVCTSPQPWSYFDPYGQLGVDTIDLYCEGGIWCDGVDIGKPASEATHQIAGWGPIEPATNGGTWGGIDDCRATWFWTTGDQAPPQYTPPYSIADTPDALVILVCSDCYETDCECGHEHMEPFYLDSGDSIDLCFCYELDMLIQPGVYTVTSSLVPTTD